jgi:flavoprotein
METIGTERIARSAHSLASPDELHALVEKSVAVVFPTLSQNTAARGAWGLRDSLPSEAMAWALKKGIPVVACRDWVCPGDGKDPYSLFLGGMLKKLEAFGVRFCSCSRLAETVTGAGKATGPKRAEIPEKPVADCRVLTASAVRDAARNGKKRIALGKGCLVTPLARDEAKDCGIEIFPGDGPE